MAEKDDKGAGNLMEMLLREFLFLAFLAQPPQEASEEALDFWRAWWKAEELDGK